MLITKRLPKTITDQMVVDWKHPRLICVAESFNRFDLDTVEIIPIRIELMTYRFYEDGVFSLESSQMTAQRASEPMPVTIKQDSADITEDTDAVDVLRSRTSVEIQSLFDDLRSRVLALGADVVERTTRSYIAYRATKNFLEVHIQRSQLRMFLRPIDYEDPKGRITKMPESFNWTLDREIRVNNIDDSDYTMTLIQQSYNDVV